MPNYLSSGLCWAYSKFGDSDEISDYFPDGWRWPTIWYTSAAIEEALVPRLNWLDNKINEMEEI